MGILLFTFKRGCFVSSREFVNLLPFVWSDYFFPNSIAYPLNTRCVCGICIALPFLPSGKSYMHGWVYYSPQARLF